jgi:hypothetical protein
MTAGAERRLVVKAQCTLCSIIKREIVVNEPSGRLPGQPRRLSLGKERGNFAGIDAPARRHGARTALAEPLIIVAKVIRNASFRGHGRETIAAPC